METLHFVTLDVFTHRTYSGNPLALVRVPANLRASLTQERKQLIAREFNLSETVFLHENPSSSETAEWTIDIFTTNDELPFAGHPTIGAACYVLGSRPSFPPGALVRGTFITKAGRIPISLSPPSTPHNGSQSNGNGEWGIVQAAIPHNVHVHAHTLGDLADHIPGLSRNPALAKAEMAAPIVSIVKGMSFLLVRLESLDVLDQVEITSSELSFHGLLDLGQGWEAGFVARYYYVVREERQSNGFKEKLCTEKGLVRVRSRMVEATMEDPATGSAACALGAYLALEQRKTCRFEMTQGVEMGRRSVIGVEVVVDAEGRKVQSVSLSGSAVQVMEGTLRI